MDLLIIKGVTYYEGDEFIVLDNDAHFFPVGSVVTYTGEREIYGFCFSLLGDACFVQTLRVEQVEPK